MTPDEATVFDYAKLLEDNKNLKALVDEQAEALREIHAIAVLDDLYNIAIMTRKFK